MTTYRQPLGVVNLVGTKERIQRIVSGNNEPGKVHKEFAADVEEDQEEVEADEAEEGVDLGDTGLFLEVVEDGILGKLQ